MKKIKHKNKDWANVRIPKNTVAWSVIQAGENIPAWNLIEEQMKLGYKGSSKKELKETILENSWKEILVQFREKEGVKSNIVLTLEAVTPIIMKVGIKQKGLNKAFFEALSTRLKELSSGDQNDE